jgi:hypothetical protein
MVQQNDDPNSCGVSFESMAANTKTAVDPLVSLLSDVVARLEALEAQVGGGKRPPTQQQLQGKPGPVRALSVKTCKFLRV